MKLRVRLASANAGKLRELAPLLGGTIELAPPPDDWRAPAEDGATYETNARLKADALFAATGEPSLGDDSGLEVDALGGAPGVLSARFAPSDRERIERLRCALLGVPDERRTARFRCVLVLRIDEKEITAEGVSEGRILDAPRGAGGFGYDPIFAPDGEERSFAEMGGFEKDRVSHRGRAARALVEALATSPGGGG